MNTTEYWHSSTNPESGDKFEGWYKSLCGAHDGTCDLDKLIATDFGREMTELAALRYRFEQDTMGEECLAFYRELGVKKEFFTDGDFYSHWMLFTPLELEAGRRYPLIFWNHGGGNAIETDEFSVRFSQMAGKEKFIVAMLQDTRWERVNEKIELISAMYPVDSERIYVTGYSQGGQAAHSALIRIPEKLAGAAPCGAEAFQLWDHLDKRYTMEELEHLRDVFVPVIQINGECEFLSFLPNNHYAPIVMNPFIPGARITSLRLEGHDLAADPTNPVGKRADKPYPPKNCDPDRWKLQRLNLRLYTQRCEPVNMEESLRFHDDPGDRFHYVMGFAGDREETRVIGGVRHYIADKMNYDGLCAYRYIGVENFPHWPSPWLAQLVWEYLKNFRRDSAAGKILCDPYIA